MILYVLLADGRIQAWAEVSSSLSNRWSLLHELELGFPAQCMFVTECSVYVGGLDGTLKIASCAAGKLSIVSSIPVCPGDTISRVAVAGNMVAFSFGLGKIGVHDLASSSSFVPIDDQFLGCSYLQWSAAGLLAVKYNMFYRVSGKSVEREEIVPADLEPEGFAAATMVDNHLWLLAYSGRLYKFDHAANVLRDTIYPAKDLEGGYLGIQVSSSGRTAAIAVKNGLNFARVCLTTISASTDTSGTDDCRAWEVARFPGDTGNTSSVQKVAFISQKDPNHDTARQQFLAHAADGLIRLFSTENPALAQTWRNYKLFLENPQDKWSALKEMPAVQCPDCSHSRVLFESFSEAKCQAGHVLRRCAGTFTCLGTLSPYESCEDCQHVFVPNLFDLCPFCEGRLFFVP